jgi:FAD/FMN-containing dehydrogenase
MALDLVNADGDLIHASETENSDYLWAARGGGAGFPGVAVRFHLKLYPRPKVMMFSDWGYPLEAADDVLAWYGEALLGFPKSMESSLNGRYENGKPVLHVAGRVITDSVDEAHAALELVGKCPAVGTSFSQNLRVPASWPGDAESPATLSPTGARFITDGAWTDASTREIVKRIRPFFDSYPTKESWYLWMVWGETQQLPDMAYSIQGHSYLSPNATWYDPADDARCARWAQDTIDAVRDISNGGKMNDDNMAVNKLPYLSPTAAARLVAIQKKYDPERRFVGFLA